MQNHHFTIPFLLLLLSLLFNLQPKLELHFNLITLPTPIIDQHLQHLNCLYLQLFPQPFSIILQSSYLVLQMLYNGLLIPKMRQLFNSKSSTLSMLFVKNYQLNLKFFPLPNHAHLLQYPWQTQNFLNKYQSTFIKFWLCVN